MNLSRDGLDFIKSFEGFSPVPYKCPSGYLTIGYGHLIKSEESFSHLTEEEALNLLEQDIQKASYAVQRLIEISLNQNQFDALCSFTFNLGAGALQRSTLRQKINRSEFIDAGDEFLRWVRAKGRILPGLMVRRTQERLLFLS